MRNTVNQLFFHLQEAENLTAHFLLAGLEGLELLGSLGDRLLQGNKLDGLLLKLPQHLLLLHDELKFTNKALLAATYFIGSADRLGDFRCVFSDHIRQNR